MREPKPGDSFTKNGIEFVVHEVRNGEVYGARWRAGMDKELITESMPYRMANGLTLEAGVPDAAIDLCRIGLADFWREVEVATAKP